MFCYFEGNEVVNAFGGERILLDIADINIFICDHSPIFGLYHCP